MPPAHTGSLVVLRGNSGSGKSTVARMVQLEFARAECAVISQDRVRREILRERDVPDGVNIVLIESMARFCLERGLTTIVEGILSSTRYGEMLDRLNDAAGASLFYAWDLSFEETVERHASRRQRDDFTIDQMAEWYHGWQPLDFIEEVAFGADVSADSAKAVSSMICGGTVPMAIKRQPPRAEGEPMLKEVAFGELDDTDGASLRPGGLRELERLSDADLKDRDLHELRLIECEWVDTDLTGADLRGSRFDDVLLDRISATVLRAADSAWQGVHIRNSRIGSAELFESEWRSVQFTNCKIGYLNLRNATLTDVRFSDCQIDEIDLGDATVTRAAFPRSTLTTLDLRASDLVALDLRGLELSTISGVESISGAWVDESQLVSLTPILTRHLGLRVFETGADP